MNAKAKMFLTLILCSLFLNPVLFVVGESEEDHPMKDLRPGWDVMPLYEIAHPPGANCIGENGNLYYVDNLNHILMKMDGSGVHTEVISTGNLSFTDIEYQPNYNRMIGVTTNGFYSITESQISLLQSYNYIKTLSEMAVNPIDDSFYCGSLFDDTAIFLFDADANNLSTIITGVKGCSQLILNNNQTILYYTQTYNGTISQLTLATKTTKLIRSGIGIPGTQEVIGIGVDDNDVLYGMTADGNGRGFYKYANNTYEEIMASKLGMGHLTWSTNLQTFITAASFGGCLIGYDPTKTTADILTPVVNSFSLIETVDGKIIYSIEDSLYELIDPATEPSVFGKAPKDSAIDSMVVDIRNKIYAALSNDSVSIYNVDAAGVFTPWFTNEIAEVTKKITYDKLHDDIILITSDEIQNYTKVYRIPADNPTTSINVITLENSTKTSGVVDDEGNIYIYEALENSLYKLAYQASELVLLTTQFVNFTDIYGPDTIVEPSICYCSAEHGILIGRNDDLDIWLLNESQRVKFAINNKGIDNSAIYQNHNNEVLCTQSTLIIKMIYIEPTLTPTSTAGIDYIIHLVTLVAISITIQFIKRKKISSQN